ncbi:hypothetical protein M7I_0782 [Glarea lozoyensis 74030]|uniref:Uncharacterized protein n=1 Tax=Glarea lozoyensis (strain ATCC 74030 / MF5533) TaxID=1104152 RepID=H0EEA8_GLAL7|nr:hypothetical protein M7I_0782 [Glarea lozoyensis 74030]
MVIGSYALSVATVGEMQDPRLKDFISQVRQRQQQRRGGLEMPQGQNGRPGQPAPMPAPQKQDYDDASPTGGIYTEEDFQQSKPAVPVVPSRPAPAEAEAKSFDFFDDASPTGGQGISADTRAAPQSTGSAWDRLRRGQAPSQAPSQASSSQETQGSGRRDGQLDAQAEFDARIERERRGGDFSSNGGDIKRCIESVFRSQMEGSFNVPSIKPLDTFESRTLINNTNRPPKTSITLARGGPNKCTKLFYSLGVRCTEDYF